MADTILTSSMPEAGTTSPENQKDDGVLARIGTGVRTATFALALGIGSAQAQQPTEPVKGPILLAQANIEDGRRGPFTAFIPQLNDVKNMKEIKFYRDKDGAIIPPDVIDGKLLDGSDAPTHPLRAKNAQVKILAKYDPLILVKTEKNDILQKADQDLKEIVVLTKRGDILTQEQLSNGFFSVYIIKLGLDHQGVNELLSGLETIAKVKMKMSDSEIVRIKREAELKATSIWKSISGNVA